MGSEEAEETPVTNLDKKSLTDKKELLMFNIGFLWLALSIGSEITGTSMIKNQWF